MKQASFKIDKIDKIDKMSEVENKKDNNLSVDSGKNDSTNITSKKPIKLVENIYYFTPPNTNINM